MFARVSIALVCLSLLVSTSASAQSLRASIASAAVQQSATDWQKEYDAAIARKNSSKRKMLIGVAVMGAGIITSIVGQSDSGCGSATTINGAIDCSKAIGKIGIVAGLGGSGILAWGYFQYSDAVNDMRSLESRRPAGRDAAVLVLDAHQAIALTSGTQKTLAYRVSW